MKFLFLSQTADGLGVAQRVRLEGHEVAVWIKNKEYHRSGLGIVERPASWREKLKWADIFICDMVGMGQFEGVLKATGKPYLCCSPVMDRLELNRAAGMEVFCRAGISTPKTADYNSPQEAQEVLSKIEWTKGFALKADGNIGCDLTKIVKEKEQLEWALGLYPTDCHLLVQELVEGVEVSTEGWFNGTDWIHPFNHTFEEKRFMEGNLGPNTGCMGNVVLARESNKLTRATVERLKPFLAKINWRGPVDVNCIVNEKGAYALEATARFGYDAIEALLEGLRGNVGIFLHDVARGGMVKMDLTEDTMICVRLTVPPYPLEDVKQMEWGEPILGINENNINHLWLCNVFVGKEDKFFRVADADGVVLKATARGQKKGADFTSQARDRVYRTLENVRLGGKQYRLDIGRRVNADVKQLIEWGWLES